ncbi:LamG domain-containing protein [Bythopirellula goksoeyrii]|uniref:LamG-like jellyroll fold domain-containing protein n=1 Tax=Bythopirellula goksoeyrii TaxID=1400387 RepID=A0A5B9QN26_9BACT|nr:LamG domain-containing protein [Bythopirellula goksoeyrii]QEG35403.1 hypothetical protein Pr1d_27020 [Bythopirellula goksoeyrii]
MKAYLLFGICNCVVFISGVLQAAVLPSLQSSLANYYSFDRPLGGNFDSLIEIDLGTDQTNIALLNGAPRIADAAWSGSTYSLQTGQNSDTLSNDDWKAGIQFLSSAESTLIGTKHVTGISLMGWFKPLGNHFDNPSLNTNTPAGEDRYNAFGLFGLLRGDENLGNTDGHAVRALLEVINDRITGLGRRLDSQPGSGSIRSVERWDQIMIPGEWCHLTATFDFDRGEVALYKNGLPIETENLSVGNWDLTEGIDYTSNESAGGIKIGGSFPDNSQERNPFNGLIDELMAFNQWLTPDLVLAQYQLVSGLPGDLDGDHDVDGADFLQIQRSSPHLLSSWQEQYGIGIEPQASATNVQDSLAAPEPSGICLAFLAMLIPIAVGR